MEVRDSIEKDTVLEGLKIPQWSRRSKDKMNNPIKKLTKREWLI